eukprot:1161739-Pelagomonas_calceolata.AAC.6
MSTHARPANKIPEACCTCGCDAVCLRPCLRSSCIPYSACNHNIVIFLTVPATLPAAEVSVQCMFRAHCYRVLSRHADLGT